MAGRREFLMLGAASLASLAGNAPTRASDTPHRHNHRNSPRWRGFNLLEKFYRNDRFRKSDFEWIAGWGFNFVRLPMDYLQWTDAADPYTLREEILEHIDEAVEFGRACGIHVCLNLHNAPGFSVNRTIHHKLNLWQDIEAQQQFAFQWTAFAKRYRGIPSSNLSFNLVNEPVDVDEPSYVRAMRSAIDGIRMADPDRMIITDGLDWGNQPVHALAAEGIAQSMRGYDPFALTHYRAGWVDGADAYPPPQWPAPLVNGYLFSPSKPALHTSMAITGPFPQETTMRIRVGQVSARAKLIVQADERTIFEHDFQPGPGNGDWKHIVYQEHWGIHQNIYDRDYHATIPAGTREVRLTNTLGDWMTITAIGLMPGHCGPLAEQRLTITDFQWAAPQRAPIQYHPDNPDLRFRTQQMQNRKWLSTRRLPTWKQLAATGTTVIIGEWGAYQHTPHDVVMRWAKDQLSLWEEARIGWALWNFRGPFGILDSMRADVDYVDFHGHRLDRQFLELLTSFIECE